MAVKNEKKRAGAGKTGKVPAKAAGKASAGRRGLKAAAATVAAKTSAAPRSGAPGVYDESKIKTLSSLEHIRLRTGMYIGRLGDGSNPDDGIYVLLKEEIGRASCRERVFLSV
jgi:topoisomerase-4 subunit B